MKIAQSAQERARKQLGPDNPTTRKYAKLVQDYFAQYGYLLTDQFLEQGYLDLKDMMRGSSSQMQRAVKQALEKLEPQR